MPELIKPSAVLASFELLGLLKSKLLLDDAERMLCFCGNVSLGSLDQIVHSALAVLGKAQRFTEVIEIKWPIPMPFISGRFSIPW